MCRLQGPNKPWNIKDNLRNIAVFSHQNTFVTNSLENTFFYAVRKSFIKVWRGVNDE